MEEQQLSVQLEASVVPRLFPTTQDASPLDTIAPAGYHYMPDGTLMSDIQHMELYGTTPSVESARLYDATSSATKYYNPYERDPVSTNAPLSGINKVITDLEIDLKDIKASGESRGFKVLGDDGAVFSLEIKNEDDNYYNFKTQSLQAAKTRLTNMVIEDGFYAGVFKAPEVADADQYDIYLTAEKGTEHANYREARFTDGNIDINSSKGSNSLLLQKVIYQTLDLTITISNYSPTGVVASIGLTNDTLIGSRGKAIEKTPFEIKATFTSGAISIDRQPTSGDIIAYVTRTKGCNIKDSEINNRIYKEKLV